MTFNALVLAGSRGGADPAAACAGVADKAMIQVGGRTMLHRVIDALRETGASRILVVASSTAVKEHAASLGVEAVNAAAGPSRSAALGFELLGAPLLVTTADHALLEARWVSDFLGRVPSDADVAMLLAERAVIERDVPGTKRTYLRFADGAWSGCNLFYLATPQAMRVIDFWQSVEADRKKPWRIVRRLGPRLLLRYITGRLSIATALGHVGDRLGARIAMVPSRWGLAAVDVDKPADLDLVRSLVEAPLQPASAPA